MSDLNYPCGYQPIDQPYISRRFRRWAPSTPTTDLFIKGSTVAEQYPLAPDLAYTPFRFGYSLVTLGIFIWASSIMSPMVQAPNGKTVIALELQIPDLHSIGATTFPEGSVGQPRLYTSTCPTEAFAGHRGTPCCYDWG